MARRLPVVLAQSPVASAERRTLEEELATLLMLERGLDVTVIPHLADLQTGSTGLLCLEGIHGAMVLLCWLAPKDAIDVLRQHGISGQLGRTRFTTAAPQSQGDPSERRIHGIDLREVDCCELLVKEICRIRDEAQVQTVTLGGPFNLAPLPASDVPSPSDSPAGESDGVLGNVSPSADRKETGSPNTPVAGAEAHSKPIEDGRQAEAQQRPPAADSPHCSSTSPASHDSAPANSSGDAAEDDEALDVELDDLLDQFDQLKW